MIKLFKHMKPFLIPLAVALIMIFFQSLSELYLPNLMSDIVDTGIIRGDTAYILKTGGFMLLIALGGTFCNILAGFLGSRVAVGFGRNLRNKVFSRVESYSLHEFDRIGTATLITRTTNDITQIQMFIVIMLTMMVRAPMMSIGGIIMALSKDSTLTLVFLVVIPVLGVFIGVIASKGLPLFKLIQKKLDKLNLVLREGLTGIRVIRAFNKVEHDKARFDEANTDLTNTAVKAQRLMAVIMPAMMLIMNLTSIAIIWFGGLRIESGGIQVGDMMAFLQYALQILFSLIMVSMMFVMYPRASVSAGRVNEVLDTVTGIHDPEQAKKTDHEKGYVEFRDVTFSYPGAEAPAISHISFCACPGEVTAIIGSTGAGKSTLVNLIPRFYDTDSGSVLVDGVDTRDMTQEDLRSRIGYVPQQAILFSGTITDNIRYGKQDASPEEVRQAAETAQAAEFINSMKDEYDSVIAQGGTNLSGGQKQRLAIARALVRKPEIYIFDDSFSALDYRTDARLRAALRQEIREATVLIVAQRVSTVMDADRIIVLDDGEIAGTGTHRELLTSCEVYYEIVTSQLSEEEIA